MSFSSWAVISGEAMRGRVLLQGLRHLHAHLGGLDRVAVHVPTVV